MTDVLTTKHKRVTYVTFPSDVPRIGDDDLDAAALAAEHHSKVRAFIGGAQYYSHLRPDGTRRVTFSDGRTFVTRPGSKTREQLVRQLKLEYCEQRLAFLQSAWGVAGNDLARTLIQNGYASTTEIPELGMGPLWAEREAAILSRAATYHRAFLNINGCAGTRAEESRKAHSRARSNAATAKRMREYRARKKTQEKGAQ